MSRRAALVMTIAVIWPNSIDARAISPANVLRDIDLFVPGMIGAIALGGVIVATAVSVWFLFRWPSTQIAVERLLDTRAGHLRLFIEALSFSLYLMHYAAGVTYC